MNNIIWGVIGGVGGSIITTLGAVAIAKRKASGKIDTTEAVTLWAESQAMRRELREEVTILRGKLDEALNQIDKLRARIAELEHNQ